MSHTITLILALMAVPLAAQEFAFDKPEDFEGWETEFGNWRIEEGALLQPEAGPNRTITWLPGAVYGDIDISVEFFIHPVGDGVKAPGLVYRARNQDEYYYIHYDLKNSQVVWVRSEAGQEWAEARRHRPFAMREGEWHTARVVCTGDEHQVYLDGNLLFTERDDAISAGVVALRTGQGRVSFRNLRLAGTAAELETPFTVRLAPFLTVCSDAGTGAYEAFPDVCMTHAGELLCVFYAGYGHVSVPNEALPMGARISMVRSTDGGKTWSAAETVVDTPIDDRDPSITQLSNGDLLVTYMSYDPGRRPGTHQVFTIRSTDGGATWGEPRRVPTPFDANEAVSEPVREMPDGRLLFPVYGSMLDQPQPRYVSAVLESNDMGETWETLAFLRSAEYELSEPSLARMPDGRLLMLIRPVMTWTESTDEGKTWTEPTPMPVSGDAPYLLLTSKDILLCGFRHRPTASTVLIYSRDFGRTWSDMILLDRVLGAYPSMVELPDGKILVVYYTEGGGSDIRAVFVKADEDEVRLLEREEW